MADTYQITWQGQTHEITPVGQVLDVMQIIAVTKPSGYQFFVRIPLADYPGRVAEILTARAAMMESTGSA